MDTKKMKVEDIITWCVENGQVDWLKATAAKKTVQKKYPKFRNAEGKLVVDKSATPYEYTAPITFVELKSEFIRTFFPDQIKAAEKKPSFHELIAKL